ncbi:MAG: phosphoglucosamine mutase, partial [Anaeroplasmataceae bacterium]|nr:phosphoglucosamine mutase [Anaeroplasmataceae bacterium]
MKYFGTDGIRGIPNQSITVEECVKIGKALYSLNNTRVILGTDTRASKDMLASAIIAGCLSVGIHVDYVGVITTPGIIYLSKIKKTIGIMITASHNPYQYNGIKIINQGQKLSLQEEEAIEKLIDQPISYFGEIGSLNYTEHYLKEYHKKLFTAITPTDLKIAVDCANGATYQTASLIFPLVSNHCILIGNEPDGYNINKNCGSTHLEALSQTVVTEKCDLGIAFDGDGDRILCVDKSGNVVDGDCIIYLLACHYEKNKVLKNHQIALTIMSNLGIIQSLKQKGIEVIETRVGDKNIADAIHTNDLLLGGENSGHIILSHLSSTGDGILVALELIRVLEETKTSIEDWIKDIQLYPDVLQNV